MKPTARDFDRNAYLAERQFYDQGGKWRPVPVDSPFLEALEEAPDGEDGEAGPFEMRQRCLAVRMLFAYLTQKGAHPANLLKQLVCVARAMRIEPFASMEMNVAALLMSETTAAHSYRCKIISGEIEWTGIIGSRMPGQKTKDSSASYAKVRKGNRNRNGGTKAKEREERAERLRARSEKPISD